MSRRLMIVLLVGAIAVAALALLRRDGGNDHPELSGPVAVPPKAAESPVYGVPLPQGAVAIADETTPEFEAFSVEEKRGRFGDVDEFYRVEMEGRPFHEMAWCGMTTDDIRYNVVRVWKQDSSGEVLTVSLQRNDDRGPRISIARSVLSDQSCPPSPLDAAPEGAEQP